MRHNFPCKECLLKGNCSELCEDIIKDTNDARILNFIVNNKCCPDCGGTRLLGCGGEILRGNRVFVDSSALCIECGSLFYKHDKHNAIIGRYRKHMKVLTHENRARVRTFWQYLHNNNFISDKVYNYGKATTM